MSSSQPGSIQPAYPGQVLPVVLPPPAGSNGSIHQNAAALNNQSIAKQTAINNTGGSRRRSKSRRSKSRRSKSRRRFSNKRKGGAGTITVAVPPVSYPETGASNQTIAGVSTQATSVGTSGTENGKFDTCLGAGPTCTAGIKGGRSKRRMKGGCPSPWGCMSGGKRRKRSKKRKGSKMKGGCPSPCGCMSGGKRRKTRSKKRRAY